MNKEEALQFERYRLQYAEDRKIERLTKEIESWEKTRKIKSYLRVLSRANLTTEDPKTLEWIDWIKSYLAKREVLPFLYE